MKPNPGGESWRVDEGDAREWLGRLEPGSVQLAAADPPYFRVQEKEAWDNQWPAAEDYVAWSMEWLRLCRRALRDDGLVFVFGQPGKREHAFLHLMAQACGEMAFHDLVIWDRVVGSDERRDSFTPCYEMILVLRKGPHRPYFDKNAVREPYDPARIRAYLRDPRYKDMEARRRHLEAGKYATNIWRIPSLKGNSREKAGHPSQKPLALMERIVAAGSRPGDLVVDPFAGSGTTGVAAVRLGRRFLGVERDPAFAALARRRIAGAALLDGLAVPPPE